MSLTEILAIVAVSIVLILAIHLRKQKVVTYTSKSYFDKGSKPTVADVIKLYRQLDYTAVADRLEGKAIPCFRLTAEPSDSQPFFSRIGGLPDLPDVSRWPKHKGKSLSFIAQLNLEQLPSSSRDGTLPTKGILYFFYDSEQSTWGFDPKDKGTWRVLYVENPPDNFAAVECPNDIPDHARYKQVLVRIEAAFSIPDPSELLSEFSLSDKQENEILDIYCQFSEQGGTLHQLLGHPVPIQGDMRLECQLVSHGLYCGDPAGYNDPRSKELEVGASDWRLLLQVDSDDSAGMMWGDCGRLYFWIKEEDLIEKRFENVWMILQCG